MAVRGRVSNNSAFQAPGLPRSQNKKVGLGPPGFSVDPLGTVWDFCGNIVKSAGAARTDRAGIAPGCRVRRRPNLNAATSRGAAEVDWIRPSPARVRAADRLTNLYMNQPSGGGLVTPR